MRTTIDELRFLDEVWKDVVIRHRFFGNGTRAFDLISLEEGPLSKPTINLEVYGLIPSPDCFWIKDYDGLAELGEALVQAGVIRPTGCVVTFGPYESTAHEFTFTDEYKPQAVGA